MMNERSMELDKLPIKTLPSPFFHSAQVPEPKAIGNRPTISARFVINIGRNQGLVASITAVIAFSPVS